MRTKPDVWKPTKIKCPKCKSQEFTVSEIFEECIQYEAKEGAINLTGWNTESGGDMIEIFCDCRKCGHRWKPRKVHDVYDIVDYDETHTFLNSELAQAIKNFKKD